MPKKEQPNSQLCTFSTASSLAERLNKIGVPVETIFEIQSNGDKVDTTDELFVDNGELHQYVAKVWGGPEANLGMTNAMFEQNGYTYDSFTHLATSAGRLPVEAAILPLKGNIDAINSNLARQMRP